MFSMIDTLPTASSPEEQEKQSTQPAAERPRKRRGFAAMDPKKVSEIASKGGKAAHRAGTAHEFTPDEAREAGRKGGYATHAKRKAASSGTLPAAPSSTDVVDKGEEPPGEPH